MSQPTFGERLKAYRDERDMSQQDLADILGTTKQVLSRYETGQRDPKLTTVSEYASKLNLPISYFWSEDSLFEQDTNVLSSPDLDITPFEREVITRLRRYSEEKQRAFLLILTGEDTPEL